MARERHNLQAIACGIFKREIEELIRCGKLSLSCKFLDSMLHMMPALLEYNLDDTIANSDNSHTVLIFGDCQPRMFEMVARTGVCRVEGMNCCEIILGKKRYHQLRAQGAFFLLPEWTERWVEVFQKNLGFNEENAKIFMGEMHTKLLYLDTGVTPVPTKALRAAAEFCGLPAEIVKVNLDHLLKVILNAMESEQIACCTR